MKLPASPSGFTLLELLLVFAIIVTVTAAGVVGLSQITAIFRLRAAADETRALFQLGRELTLARQDQTTYQLALDPNLIQLKTIAGTEIARYAPPTGVVYTTPNNLWSFTPVSGLVSGCTLPCQIQLSLGGNTETINLYANGLID